jgi:preprotein translocase subunit SecE
MGELQKCNWPWDPKEKAFGQRYKELIDSTIVVVIVMLLLAAYICFWDFALLALSKLIS